MSLLRSTITADPFGFERTMRQMMGAVDRLMGDVYGTPGTSAGLLEAGSNETSSGLRPLSFTPRVDMYESDQALQIICDLPGIPKDAIKMEVKDGALWLMGETSKDSERAEGTYHVRERFQGMFRRVIPMPAAADLESVKAKYDNGVLCVEVPKKPEHTKQITVD